jgi:hypothetical protein
MLTVDKKLVREGAFIEENAGIDVRKRLAN